jgi:hypothetical protein
MRQSIKATLHAPMRWGVKFAALGAFTAMATMGLAPTPLVIVTIIGVLGALQS